MDDRRPLVRAAAGFVLRWSGSMSADGWCEPARPAGRISSILIGRRNGRCLHPSRPKAKHVGGWRSCGMRGSWG